MPLIGRRRRADAPPTGFFAETVQVAVASYQPVLPEGESLEGYLDRLIAEAKAGVERPAADPAQPST